MRPTDEVKVVAVEKFANNVHPKREGDTTVVLAPTMNIFVRIWPQQVTQKPWKNHAQQRLPLIVFVLNNTQK